MFSIIGTTFFTMLFLFISIDFTDSIIEFTFLSIIVLAIVFDFVKNKTKHLMRRFIFYSFIFYLLQVIRLTTGYITWPPFSNHAMIQLQLIPFYFITDWYSLYQQSGSDWFFWNSIKLTVYNLIMLAPLGVYLSLLFNIRSIKKAALIIFLTSLTIETYQLIFSTIGLIFPRTFNVDDLILNTLGGCIGFGLWQLVRKVYEKKNL